MVFWSQWVASEEKGQAIPAQYCNTVAQSGKLKQHIATRHADQLPIGAAGNEDDEEAPPGVMSTHNSYA